MSPPRFGVLLANLGTPDAPTPKAVRRYLREFLSDRRVVDLPRWKWWPILNGIVLAVRPRRVAKAYASIWTDEGSPLLAISRRQRAALEQKLEAHFGEKIPVALGMSYGNPSIASAGLALRDAGVKNVLVLPLYPQFSAATTASIFDQVARALKQCPAHPGLRFVRSYCDHPLYIQALANTVREHWQQEGQQGHLVMSYHGIPKRYAEQGDPYPRECETTSRLLAEALSLSSEEWSMTYQSRFGREEWMQPYTDETLIKWGASGTPSDVDIMSPAFAADCLETLEELNEENRENFLHAGGKRYAYIPALNDRDDHLDLMTALVQQHSQGW